MKKLVSYIEICSNSLLALSDCIEDPIYIEDSLFLDFKNKEIKNKFYEILLSNIKGEREFGKDIILINTCSPIENWKFNNQKNLSYYSFVFTGSIKANYQSLQMEIDKIWHSLKRNNILHDSFKLIDHPNIDYQDITIFIRNKIEDGCLIERKPSQFAIRDSNLYGIKNLDNIKNNSRIFQELELNLITKKIILAR